MDAERYARVKEILGDLLDLDPAAREAGLAAACGDDVALRRDVEELLALGDQETTDSDQRFRPLDRLTVVTTDAGNPSRIGPYRILDTLGFGGMGTVYRAEQNEPIERTVALKVIRRELVDDAVRLRFSAERQALARLAHPAIAQLYQVGETDDGSPYFAMELVEGLPLTHHCSHSRLGIAARLELFRRVCDGVAHAHQKGILHRDLKPSNILVERGERDAVPKIIDFGIAKAIDRPLVEATLLTGGGLLGTPAYMSPEAARDASRVDTRSDVYSLGVVLYELLVGVRPFGQSHDDPLRLLSRITQEDAVRPSTRWRRLEESTREGHAVERGLDPAAVSSALEGDLDWIVMKAIAKEPGRRYASPRDLADDLGRHLRHEPVEARPPTFGYRVSRFVRRNRLAVGAAVLLVLSLFAGMIGTGIGLVEARREADAARRALAEASAVSDYLVELFRLAAPVAAEGQDVTARDLLSRGGDVAAEHFVDQPLARARFLRTIAQSYQNLGLYVEAVEHFEESLAVLDAVRTEPTSTAWASAWAEALTGLAWSEHRRGRYDVARSHYETALVAFDREPEHFGSLRASAVESLAYVAMEQGEYDEAKALLNEALEAFRSAPTIDREAVLGAVDKLGVVEQRRGDFVAAERLHREALATALEIHGPVHPVVATAWLNLMSALYGAGDLDAAHEAASRALEIRRQLYGDDHDEVARAINNLAAVEMARGEDETAERLYLEALETSRRLLGPSHPKLASLYNNLAVVSYSRGDLETTLEYLETALSLREAALGEDHPDVARLRSNLGSALYEAGRVDEAETMLLDAQRVLDQRLGPDHDLLALNLEYLGILYAGTERKDLAVRTLERAVAMRERVHASDHPALAAARELLVQARSPDGGQSSSRQVPDGQSD